MKNVFIRILYYGRIHHDKGTIEAVKIAKVLVKRLIIAGIIQDEHYFKEHVVPYLKSGKIGYIGSVGPEKRNELLANASVLLHPINFDEPFGLSIVEAMACGTPVIAFNKGSMPELIDDSKTGFLVTDIAEAIEKAKHTDSINRMACRKKVEQQFSKERMSQKYMELYKQILDRQ